MVNKKTSKALASKGFTIIELLVVVAIIGILAVGGIIKRKESLQRKRTEIETLKIKQMVELARDYALTGEVITVSGDEFVPHYFEFKLKTDGKYGINALNDNFDKLKNIQAYNTVLSESKIKASDDLTIRYKVPYADCSLGPPTLPFGPPTGSTSIICSINEEDCTPANSSNYTITINDASGENGKGIVTIE